MRSIFEAAYNFTRVDDGGKKLNYSRDKNEGTYRSGEGGEGPTM